MIAVHKYYRKIFENIDNVKTNMNIASLLTKQQEDDLKFENIENINIDVDMKIKNLDKNILLFNTNLKNFIEKPKNDIDNLNNISQNNLNLINSNIKNIDNNLNKIKINERSCYLIIKRSTINKDNISENLNLINSDKNNIDNNSNKLNSNHNIIQINKSKKFKFNKFKYYKHQ